LGARPVLAPDSVASAPVDVMNEPLLHLIACSYSSVFGFDLIFQQAYYPLVVSLASITFLLA
jgi:hypothetical protein